jgi:hypothetical protein
MGISWFVSLGDKSTCPATTCCSSGSTTRPPPSSRSTPSRSATRASSPASPGGCRSNRPIVAVRTGAALIGPGTGALYQQAGVIEVPTVVAMLDTARVMATQPADDGDRVAVSPTPRAPACSPGPPRDGRAARRRRTGPPRLAVLRRRLRDAVRARSTTTGRCGTGHPRTPGGRCHHRPRRRDRSGGGRGTKPVVAVMLGALDGPLKPGSPVQRFAFPEPAAAVLGRLHSYWRWRATEGQSLPEAFRRHGRGGCGHHPRRCARRGSHHARPSPRPSRCSRRTASTWPTLDSSTPQTPSRRRPTWVIPVAVKAERRRVGHSVQAGVALDLIEADDIVNAIATMREHLGDDAARVMVQRMVPPGVNLRLHVTTDGQLGPVVTVGLGGAQRRRHRRRGQPARPGLVRQRRDHAALDPRRGGARRRRRGPGRRSDRADLDGNEAAARVAYALSEVIAIYPITPASPMGEHADAWAARGRPEPVGRGPRGRRDAVRGRRGRRAARRAPEGRAGHDVHRVAGPAADAAEHVQDRRRAHPGGDPRRRPHARHPRAVDLRRPQRRHGRPHHRLGDARAGSVQEAHDFALVAHAATLRTRVPFLHFFDGFRTSHEIARSSCSTTTTCAPSSTTTTSPPTAARG